MKIKQSEWEKVSEKLDVTYAYNTAKAMEKFGTHKKLGFRTAGSKAEYETGEFLLSQMQAIGLNAFKDEITVDGWTFTEARLTFLVGMSEVEIALGAYQTQFVTNGAEPFTLINAGRGTAEELDKIDVKGKIALVFINQRDEWWINYPAYQAHLRGAKAVIAVQNSGFGQVDEGALNAQDICGPANAPAFSMSKTDSRRLIAAGLTFGKSIAIKLTADSRVTENQKTYNITGILKGKTDDMILISAHYDSYFLGFQDDNTGVSMLLGMAKAIQESGYKPNKTLAFCAFAAEEWGTCDSRYDWSSGAYAQLKHAHPEWVDKAVLDINLELPAFSHGVKHYIRTAYEYKAFMKDFILDLPEQIKSLYRKGVGVVCPVQTWSDDFAVSLAGVPSLVNEFKISTFMETHYHSQFDRDDCYNAQIYRFHHLLYTRLMLEFDSLVLPPLNFAARFKAMDEALTDDGLSVEIEGAFRKAVTDARKAGKKLHESIALMQEKAENAASYGINLPLADAQPYEEIQLQADEFIINDNDEKEFSEPDEEDNDSQNDAAELPIKQKNQASMRKKLLKLFRFCQNKFVSLDWYEQAVFPFENAQSNVRHLKNAAWRLYSGDYVGAYTELIEIDDNSYAAVFDAAVTDYFYKKATADSEERLKWGFGRLKWSGRMNLRDLLTDLKKAKKGDDFSVLVKKVLALKAKEHNRLEEILHALTEEVILATTQIKAVTKKLNKKTEKLSKKTEKND